MHMRMRRLHSPEFGLGFYADTDEGGQGGGNSAPVTAPPTTPPETIPEPTEAEKAAAAQKAEMDRYRNEAGQAAKRAKEAEAKLAAAELEKLSETERLKVAADQVPTLTTERDDWKARAEAAEAEIAADVEARKKALPAELACLMPEGTASQQLAWIRNAEASALKLKPTTALPPGGGRNPGGNSGKADPSDKDRERIAREYATHF